MEIQFIGATQGVTGSCTLVKSNGKTILVDLGKSQGIDLDYLDEDKKFLFDFSKVNIMILTHSHLDHSGLIPYLIKNGFTGEIHCTNLTKELTKLVLDDAGKLEEKKQENALYCKEDTKKISDYIIGHDYNSTVKISKDVKFIFRDAGHMPGSSSVELITREKNETTTIAFTGDIGNKNNPLLNNPYQIKNADILITEATYGNKNHNNISVESQFKSFLIDTVNRGGKMLIPAFAIGRAQEMLYHIFESYKELPPEYKIPVILDSSMSKEATYIINLYRNYLSPKGINFFKNLHLNNFEQFKFIDTPEQRDAIISSNKPCIIISSSGMCSGGRIHDYLEYILPDPKNSVAFSGYQSENEIGRKILNRENTIKINKKNIPVNCHIYQYENTSCHAGKYDLVENAKNINGVKYSFIIHGDECAKLGLQQTFQEVLPSVSHIIPKRGEQFKIDRKFNHSKFYQQTGNLGLSVLYDIFGEEIKNSKNMDKYYSTYEEIFKITDECKNPIDRKNKIVNKLLRENIKNKKTDEKNINFLELK